MDNMVGAWRLCEGITNDIVVFSRTLNEHTVHLDDKSMHLAPDKTFSIFCRCLWTSSGRTFEAVSLRNNEETIEAIEALKLPHAVHHL